MPRKTPKHRIIEALEIDCAITLQHLRDGSKIDRCIDETIRLIEITLSSRCIKSRSIIPKCLEWYTNILPSYDEDRFRQNLRVTREQFCLLLRMIESSPVFFTQGNSKQMEVSKQLAIGLYRFGHYGNGASYQEVASKFGIGDGGTIPKIMRRVVQAFRKLRNNIIYWPDAMERKDLKHRLRKVLPGCVGFVDGSHVNLVDKPSVPYHEDYFSRKQRYGFHLQVICDLDLKIRHYRVGRTASAHDARVFAESSIGISPQEFFSSGEWIAGDAAYKLTEYMITPYRRNAKESTVTNRNRFNKTFSRYRVKAEHTYGVLFEKFPSLKHLPLVISGPESHEFACWWIEACLVLHNILSPNAYYDITVIHDTDMDFYRIEELYGQEEDDESSFDIEHTWLGEEKRKQLMIFITSNFI